MRTRIFGSLSCAMVPVNSRVVSSAAVRHLVEPGLTLSRVVGWMALVFPWIVIASALAVAPSITITNVHPYAASGVMQGVVAGVDFTAYRVAPYIQIEGLGWWTKPTFAAPTVAINPDGTFTANVTTGGLDNRATIFCAALVPTNYTPPQASGNYRVPAGLNAVAIDFMERYGRTLSFANRTWAVKEAPLPVGPGPNRFSDQLSDVWVDGAGLHLTINYRDGQWWSSEVILLDHLGYGTYLFKTQSRTDSLDVNATVGYFFWDAYGDDESSGDSHNREFDFEDSRWGVPSDPNSQSVVQPWSIVGNRHRYYLPDLSTNSTLTRLFRWQPGSIKFVALKGNQPATNYPPPSVIDNWLYLHDPAAGHYVPSPGRGRFRFNLWLNNPSAGPANGQPIEVVISDFSFAPLAKPAIAAVERIANDLRLTFTTELGGHYAVQSRSNLAAGSWTTLFGDILSSLSNYPIFATCGSRGDFQ